jgi:hypothetical protein
LRRHFELLFGQVVEYRYLHCTNNPKMIIFLDHQLDAQRIKIASVYKIAVVAQIGEEFVLLKTPPDKCALAVCQLFN